MQRKKIIALSVFSFLILSCQLSNAVEIFKPRFKERGIYDALCAAGGRFDLCDVYIKNQALSSISIDGARELSLCDQQARIGYRSNPASPYKRVSVENQNLVQIVTKEKGIDHDFLFAVPRPNSPRRETLIIRFKNHKVAIDFAQKEDKVLSTCIN